MAEREFDWPERMPEGFWIPTLQSTVRKTVTGHTLFLRGDFPYRRWEWVDLHSLGSWGAGNAVEEAYTALREHVLRQKESNMQKAHNAPQPPERAERPWARRDFWCETGDGAPETPFVNDALNWLADRQDEILEQFTELKAHLKDSIWDSLSDEQRMQLAFGHLTRTLAEMTGKGKEADNG